MDALTYLGYDPNKELPIVTKIKSDVKKLNDKNLIISKIREIETKLNFEADKERFLWNDKDDEDTQSSDKKSDKKAAASALSKNNKSTRTDAPPPAELFEPVHVKAEAANQGKRVVTNSIERISLYLEEANIEAKNKPPKVKSLMTSTFLSKLVLDKSDFLTSSVKSMNSTSDIASLEDFSSINKIDKKPGHEQGEANGVLIDDDDDEQTNSIYYEDFHALPTPHQIHHNAKPTNLDNLRAIGRSTQTNATGSSQKIDTILEESDVAN